MPNCRVVGCGSRKFLNGFPKETRLRRVWELNCGQDMSISSWSGVCINHFEQKFVQKTAKGRNKLRSWEAYPTINLPGRVYQPQDIDEGEESTTANNERTETGAKISSNIDLPQNEPIDLNTVKENSNLGSNIDLQYEDKAVILETLDHTVHNYTDNTCKLKKKDSDKKSDFFYTKFDKFDPNKTVVIDYVDGKIVWNYVDKSEIETSNQTVVIEDVASKTSKCCICFQVNIDLISFYQLDGDETYFSKMKTTFPDLEFGYANLKNLICQSCVECLNSAYNFRLRIVEAQKLLNQIPKNNNTAQNQDESQLTTNEISKNIFTRAIASLKNSGPGSLKKQHTTVLKKGAKLKDILSTLDGIIITQTKDRPMVENVAKPKKNIYGCNFCSLKFSDLIALYHHKIFNHGQERYRYQILNKFKNRNSQQTSDNLQISTMLMERMHKKMKRKTPEEPKQLIQCPKCPKRFKSELVFNQHQKWHDGIKEFCCEKCGRMFFYNSQLKIHMESHLETPNYACSSCGKLFKTKKNLKQHELQHGDAIIMCQICGKCVKTKIQLKNHLLSHTEERPHACTICSARFKSKNVLRSHIRTHTKERPFKCDQCQLAYASTHSLKVHLIKEHLKVKNFPCHICEKRFYTKKHLNQHMYSHGEKHIPCPVCQKVFKHPQTLQRHQKLIHENLKKHECPTCNKKFRDNTALRYHIERNHASQNSEGTSGSQFQCKKCNFKSFRSEQRLKMHIDKFHSSAFNHDRLELYFCTNCRSTFEDFQDHDCVALLRDENNSD